MLILTRKSGESITIGNEINVTILNVRGKNVRIGIQAPKSIVVLREEIYKAIQEENRQAARESVHADYSILRKYLQSPAIQN